MKNALDFLRRYQNPLIFIGGFLFDAVTLKRIDSWVDLALQFLYLAALTFLLIYQTKESRGLWAPQGFTARVWAYNVEALHFLYGGLLSPYTILYFKSSSGTRPIIFFLLIVALLFINEMPHIRRMGHRLRLGLYAFCVSSFLIYFVPIVIGRMGGWVFALSLLLSAGIVWKAALILSAYYENPERTRFRLFAPGGAVLSVILALYILKLVPPVPLSVQYNGVFHGVERQGGTFVLRVRRPPFYLFWRRDSRPFRARPGDAIFYFARIYAPSRFRHRVMIRWELYNPATKKYSTEDLIPLALTGGRGEGFRGYVAKAHYVPGRWRVSTETEDGRPVSVLKFKVAADSSTREPRWTQVRM